MTFQLIAVLWMLSLSGMAAAEPFRLGITSSTARSQYALLEEWRVYLQNKLDHPVVFVFRESYLENADLIKQNKLDFAWISAPAYIENRQQTDLLVTPLYRGQPYDRAYLIVPLSDNSTHSLLDLKDRVFAYVDPDSNTGYLEPRYRLRQAHHNPERFFRKTFFTRDQKKIVASIAIGLADAGSISGFEWETLAQSRPDITRQTRIVSRSKKYALPPIIARHSLDRHDFFRMQRVLLDMSDNAEGIQLLKRLNIDGFALADKNLYRSVYLMMRQEGDL